MKNNNYYRYQPSKAIKQCRMLFILSFVSIMISSIAFTGVTYAWFSYSTSVSNNRIQAGNLDVGLYAEKDETMIDLSSNVEPIFETCNLIPGESIETKIVVKNKGNLSIVFSLFFNISDDPNNLSDHLNITVINNDTAEEDEKGKMNGLTGTSSIVSSSLESKDEIKTYTIKITADENMPNDSTIVFDIKLHATQLENNDNLN